MIGWAKKMFGGGNKAQQDDSSGGDVQSYFDAVRAHYLEILRRGLQDAAKGSGEVVVEPAISIEGPNGEQVPMPGEMALPHRYDIICMDEDGGAQPIMPVGDHDIASLIGSHWFMSLEEAMYQREQNAEAREENGYSQEWWNDRWFPFLDDGEGNLTCVHLDTGELEFYEHDCEARTTVAASMQDWLSLMVEGLESGDLVLDDDEVLPADGESWDKKCAKISISW